MSGMDRMTIDLHGGDATVRGRYAGTGVLVKRTEAFLVLRFAGRKVFSGQGQPQRWHEASYEVFVIESEEGDVIEARAMFSFSSKAHTVPLEYRR